MRVNWSELEYLTMEELLNKPEFKCTLCQKLLSHPPIMLTETGDNVCGRCYNNKNVRIGLLYHNKIYEEFASELKFTCRYQPHGCAEELYLHETELHEKYCEWRVYNCPVLPKGSCGWTGTWSGLREHCKSTHQSLVIDCYPWRIQLDLTADNDRNVFLLVRGILFVMQIKYNARLKKLWHLVQYMGNPTLCCSQLAYDLTIINNDTIVKYNNPIAPPPGDIDMNTAMSVETSTAAFSASYETELRFSCKKKVNPALMNLFTCAECGYFCLDTFVVKNRVICFGCERVMYPDSKLHRNKLIIVLVYPCDNKIEGCDYLDFEWKMQKHKLYFCKYSTCYWCSEPYNENVLDHYITKHSDIVCDSNTLILNRNCIHIYPERKHFIKLVYDYIFICEYIFGLGLYVAIYSNVPDDEIQSYQCAIEIIDRAGHIEKLEFHFTPDYSSDWELALPADEWGRKLADCTFNCEIMKQM